MVAMSGGVDSSVAAALLVEQGHHAVGVTMRLWGGDSDTGCCSVADVDDARRVADRLGIEHRVFNFTDDFDRHVVAPYVSAHAAGVTPNPCIECNRHLKFDRLLERARALGFDAVATGHHARIRPVGGQPYVHRAHDRAKDQSYVVHMLDGESLERVLFPIGELTKAEVRRMAAARGLRTSDKPDSQDVCFVTRSGRAAFLSSRIPLNAGTVVDLDGRAVARVPAVELVTVGQRRGLGLPGGDDPQFVLDIDVASATVVVGPKERLSTRTAGGRDATWVGDVPAGEVLVQTSAHGPARPATVEIHDGRITVEWTTPQRRVAAGQSLVVYDRADRYVLGGGLAA
jgi:tRNA-specific 2-thiouridylase